MRSKLTPAFVQRAKAEHGKVRTIYWDASLARFGLAVTHSGARSYIVQYKAGGRSQRVTLPFALGLSGARKQARVLLGKISAGIDPMAERRKRAAIGRDTLQAIAEEFFAREGRKMRTAAQRKAAFERLIFPKLGRRPIGEIRRSEIIRLLDRIEEERGPAMAEQTLRLLSRLFSWHAARDDDFRSPIVRGMRAGGSTARSRILTDDELRAIWRTAGKRGPFGYLIRFLLLTATRRSEAGEMTWSEIEGGDWLIPAARYKTNRDTLIPLSAKARELLAEVPRIAGSDWVFTLSGKVPVCLTTPTKRSLDAACGVTGWTIHDLRRTARSLMSRAGVNADHAERCLGHVIGGVRGVYDRHEYRDEKAHAFEALAALIERIVDPRPNVTAMRRV